MWEVGMTDSKNRPPPKKSTKMIDWEERWLLDDRSLIELDGWLVRVLDFMNNKRANRLSIFKDSYLAFLTPLPPLLLPKLP